ncbi:helix-turn-helix domain-containing protein [Nocardia sp. NPDC055321]
MIVEKWTATEVKALREAALRMTQEELAAVIGFDLSTIQKWEQRATSERPVVRRSAEALDTMLEGLNAAQLDRFTAALVPARSQSGRHPGLNGTESSNPATGTPDSFGVYAWEVDDNVRRREFGQLASLGAVVLLAGEQDRLDTGDVRRLLAGVDALEREDQQSGGAALVDFAVKQLALAKNKLDTCAYDDATGDAFASATGHLAVLTGWLAYDADRHPLARRLYADAMALGTEANDPDLIAHACLNGANQSIALSRAGAGSPHHALKLIRRARDLMRGRPPGRIHALVAVREAQAYGVIGDRLAFGRALATAWREMDSAAHYEPIDECPHWLRFVTHSEIAGHEARGYGDMGEISRSVELYGAASHKEASTRNAIHLSAWSAAARAQIGDIGGAVDEGLPVLASLASVSSTRTLKVLEPVRSAVDGLALGDEFRGRFDSLTKAIAS